jgi:CRISPR-associated endonuclease Csn1
MKKILGLDLGTNSIGWALVHEAENNEEKSSIIRLGVRVNPLTVDEQQNFEKGRSITTNADRTLKRSMRRNLQRYKLRREDLIEILKANGFIGDETILSENGNRTTFETYRLRAKAATEPISLEEFARVLLAINKKRGYKSSRKAKGSDEGTLIDGMDVAKRLYDENLTPGQLCLNLIQGGQKYLPDFYRSDLQAEFDKIWEAQRKFYPDILTDELKEDLRGKHGKATWAICEKPFGIVGIKREGKSDAKRKENFAWRVDALTVKTDLERLAIVLQEINSQIYNSSGYLGAISDRSKELYFKKQTVGQYQMAVLDANPNASLRNMVFYRQDYMDEFDTLWETQAKHHATLTEELKREIRDVVIFYQRRLKSQKGLIAFCEFESRKIGVEIDGKKRIKTVGSRVIPRSSPLFQDFKIWQTLNDLEISATDMNVRCRRKDNGPGLFDEFEDSLKLYGKRELEQEEKELLAKELMFKEKLSKEAILKTLFGSAKSYDLNFKEVQGNLTRAKMFDACPETAKLPEEDLYALWHLLYSFEGDDSNTGNERLIKKLASRFGHECAVKLANIAFQDDYGSLSAKAIGKILPHMKDGNKYDVACEYAGYRHSASSLTKDEIENKTYKDRLEILPKNSLRNPVVEKILNQMVNVVNAVIDSYGKPDEIRIELARELKKNAKEREELTKSIAETTRAHNEYKKILAATPFNLTYISRSDIIRYKLYEELRSNGYKTLYSNTYISPAALFSGDFDIEHIIPQARLFDDSYANKTLELKSVNLKKGSMTAYDFVKEKYGEEGVADYMHRVETLYKERAIGRTKYNKLRMSEKDIPEGFLNRDLGNTQYITRYAKTMLGELVKRVVSTTGSITDALREDWQLVDVMKELNWDKYDRLGMTYYEENRDGKRIGRIRDWTKRNDHRHHAMDALTVAFTKEALIQLFNNLNASLLPDSNAYALKTKYCERGRVKPPIPLDEFRAEARKHLENTLISIKAKNKVATRNVNATTKKGGTNKVTQLTPRGQLHNETIYGSLKRYKKDKKGVTFESVYTIRKEISPDLKIDKVIDVGVKRILQARLDEYGGDAKNAFSNLDENPIWLNQGKGVAIKRVTISGVNHAEALHNKHDKDGLPILDENGNRQPVDFVNTGNNHHVAIYRAPVLDKKGNPEYDEHDHPKYELQEKVVSFYEAVARRNSGSPIIDKEYRADEGWEFLFSMKQNEYFVFPRVEKHEKVDEQTGEIFTEDVITFDPKDVDLLDPDNYARISPNLFRVQKLSTKNYYFRHHLETDVQERKSLIGITYKPYLGLKGIEGIVKIRINHIGEIVAVGEY